MADDFLGEEFRQFEASKAGDAAEKLRSLIDLDTNVGDLLELDYDDCTVLVHDALRQRVGGLPLGAFLLASRIDPARNQDLDPSKEDVALLLLRVTGKAALPNKSDVELNKLLAGQRALDSDENWDSVGKTDQYTLNILRMAGVRCRVLGTFRMSQDASKWVLRFGADISNFYSGQGMKVYKPSGEALRQVVNFQRPGGDDAHPLHGNRVKVARVRYAASEGHEHPQNVPVPVDLDPTDLLARRTALFGMSRTGKSNTTKVIAKSVFQLRARDPKKGAVGQLIFDVNGEYANETTQDKGCLKNIWALTANSSKDEVVTYGTHEHPADPGRRIIKLNFFGTDFRSLQDRDAIIAALDSLLIGKQLIDDLLIREDSKYIKNFRATSVEPPLSYGRGEHIRYQRNILIYRTLLKAAGLQPPASLRTPWIKGLFSKSLREALENNTATDDDKLVYTRAATVLSKDNPSWDELHEAFMALRRFIANPADGYRDFNLNYAGQKEGRSWHDDMMTGLLSLLEYPNGVRALREMQAQHDPNTSSDYADSIVHELTEGKLVIVDQSMGDPDFNRAAADRIALAVFDRQKKAFIDPKTDDKGQLVPPPDVLLYVEEAHNLLPARNVTDLDPVWSRIAKEGSKYRIGLLYATQEPSSLQSNILSNTDNWFVAHLNNTKEVSEIVRYYDFEDFAGQIAKVPEPGFLRMRTLSNPYIVPIQVDKFEVELGDQD